MRCPKCGYDPKLHQFEAETDIPIPNDYRNPGQPPVKHPWDQLLIGWSFFVPGKTAEALSGSRTAATKRTGFKFTARRQNGGVRFWRIS